MNTPLTDLQEKIRSLKKEKKAARKGSAQGYNIAIIMMTDLISCVLIGFAIGLFFQKIFHTHVLLTVFLTFLGGIAGFYSVIRFALAEEKKTHD